MKNVLYLHRTQGSAVEAVHINGIADNLEKLGFHVDFFSPSGTIKPGQVTGKHPIPQKKSILSWLSAKIPEFLFEIIEWLYNILAYIKVSRLYGSQKFDFIYERYAIFSVIGILLTNKFNCPIVLEVNYTSMSPLVRQRTNIFKPLAKWVDGWVFKRATAIIVVSGQLKQQLINKYNISADKIEIIANAANPELFKPSKQQKMGTGCVIGFVGGFYPWHGLSLLVEAMVILKKQKQDVNCLLIGDGPELAKIKSKIAQLGLENYFTFPGRIAHHELARYVEQFDIGIMPDSNNYGSPMKLFEYMAAGIPFVAADYSPIVEITTNQGELFEKKNVVSFAQALIKYTNNESIRVNAGAKGRQKVEQYFNWEKNASRTVLHLQKCIELKNNV